MRKRLTAWFLTVVMLALTVVCTVPPALAAGAAPPTRIIHVVYDDSGSMIETNRQMVDTWCQAKYAMEVFAALLGENDTMNIYVMSDFNSAYESAAPHLTLNGRSGQEANVAQIHNMVTAASGTPFGSVRKAYNDLVAAEAEEKWLVVLTDGAFAGEDDIDGYFARKSPDVQVMFLGMGPDAQEISSNPGAGVFFVKAATSKQILNEVTNIGIRIFNKDRLNVNVAARTVDFDVPMGELVIFAQGANVEIQGITSAGGKSYAASTRPVTVQYSERAATNYSDSEVLVDRNLKGSIVTFKDDFPAGTYTLDVSGADTIEVYYVPNIAIAAYLTNSDGEEVTQLSNLKEGEYTINFGFVKAGTEERVSQSALLGDVSYSASITNNGEPLGEGISSGDTVYIQEGSLAIDVTARYLEYHTVSTHLDYDIFQDKEVSLSVTDMPLYEITKDGMNADRPIVVRALLNGEAIPAEYWAAMDLPDVVMDERGQALYGPFTVEKQNEPGVYYLYPSLADGLMSSDIYSDQEFTVIYDGKMGEATWSGNTQGTLKVTDTRSWLERNLQRIIRYIIIGLIILLILGYIPPFKKYLPKRLKKRPAIDCSPNRPGGHPATARGRYAKSLLSTLIPYKAETGTIKFVPPNVSGVPVLQVKAAGGSAMLMTNTKAYAGKEDITFNGESVLEGNAKPKRYGAGVMIVVNRPEMTYTCVPSNK